ncbi:CD226 antigen-like isoform X2 [Alosa pseudoharengus]|uniref:CD226 antigen-like isoform X2 n=1 Tax=Alosa pseudoharengus TaxID=34774 RepID=UPI003F88DEE6
MKLCLCLLYTALQVTVGCTISDPKHETITRSPGESVLLSCSCTDLQIKPDEIQWRGPNDNKKEFYKLTGNLKPKVKKRYRVRVQTFSDTSPGNASLLLSNLTEEDQGEYMCVIETYSKGGIRIITLIIKREGAGEGCIISEPENETITRSPRESVLLSCSCTDLQTKPDEIRWRGPNYNKEEFYKLTGALKPKVKKRYSGRVQTFSNSSPGNASLLLSNLTEEDQGEYTCVIKRNESEIFKRITLNVKRARAGLFSTVLIIIILLVGVLGTAAVIYWRYRKRRNEPSDSRGEHSGQDQQQNEDVTYTTVVHGNTARAAPRDANTEEATEYASVRGDGDVTYSTVDHGNRARPPKEINTEENTEYSSIRLYRV